MPEPFKNLFNRQIIQGMALNFKAQWSAFDAEGFEAAASDNLEALELKQRSDQITAAMLAFLPEDYEKSGAIMLASLGTLLADDLSAGEVNEAGIAGWAVMPMAHYVGLYGHGHFDLSMMLLKEMTKRSSSEFGVRFFLLESPQKTLAVFKKWATDENHHVRRLVSEGSRPRLPWAMRLPLFIDDPSPLIELLEVLKDDEEEYVRRSVANNLNDIAKDHPDLVADVIGGWMEGAGPARKKLIRHACRTLLKQGHKKTLKTLGYGAPKIKQAKFKILTPEVKFGSALQFSLSIESMGQSDQALMIDYVVHHQKANGTTSAKVFKWKTAVLSPQKKLIVTKKHMIKKITTRVYYPGLHGLDVVVNGICVASADFQLLMD